jgi:hypothetical protein
MFLKTHLVIKPSFYSFPILAFPILTIPISVWCFHLNKKRKKQELICNVFSEFTAQSYIKI